MFSYNTEVGTLIRPAVILNGYSEKAEASVTCFVHHSYPYVWVKYDYFGIAVDDMKQKLKNDFIILKERGLTIQNHNHSYSISPNKATAERELKQKDALIHYQVQLRSNCYGYHPKKDLFVKINFNFPWMRNKIADILREGIPGTRYGTVVFEAHIEYTMQFITDYNVKAVFLLHILYKIEYKN